MLRQLSTTTNPSEEKIPFGVIKTCDDEAKSHHVCPQQLSTMKFLAGAIGLLLRSQVVAFSPIQGRYRISQAHVSMSATAEKVETLTVTPIKSLDGTVTLPGSKSLSNRCLLLAALSEGDTKVDNLLESDDIRFMLEALDQMKVPVVRHSAESVTVTGQNGPINSPLGAEEVCELFLGNAGTAMRPLAAALCMGNGKFVLDGVARMRERPIADLVDGLQQLGADVTCVEETGCPPVTINANGLKGGKVCFT
jgi:3-phosphoshikimate 1-carboxyvinyltransferase